MHINSNKNASNWRTHWTLLWNGRRKHTVFGSEFGANSDCHFWGFFFSLWISFAGSAGTKIMGAGNEKQRLRFWCTNSNCLPLSSFKHPARVSRLQTLLPLSALWVHKPTHDHWSSNSLCLPVLHQALSDSLKSPLFPPVTITPALFSVLVCASSPCQVMCRLSEKEGK